MKPATNAPLYGIYYKEFAELARSKGYALAVHGSLQSDVDFIAVPWTEDAVEQDELVRAICDMCNGHLVDNVKLRGNKPHGRTAYTIVMSGIGYIDLSIMKK